MAKVQTKYIELTGGVDYMTSPLQLKPGQLIAAQNYEQGLLSGYRRIDGYERYDGQDSPSAESTSAAQEIQRALITVVPGEGNILGVWVYKNVIYAFRNAVGGATAGMYKSSAAGWVAVSTALTAGGKYEFLNYTFDNAGGVQKMHFVNGTGKLRTWDGTTLVEVTTGMTADTPSHLAQYGNRLWMAFPYGVVEYSAPFDPTSFTPLAGANVLSIGDEITGFATTPGATFAIFARNSTHIVNNYPGVTGFGIDMLSEEAGAIEWTLQQINTAVYLDDRGLTNLTAVQEFGDFSDNNIAPRIQPYFDARVTLATDSIRVKSKSQYRIFFSDKTCMNLTFRRKKLIGALPIVYPVEVLCTCTGEDSAGNEILFFGSDTGYVYQMDSGTNFDGAKIAGYIRTAFYPYGTPRNDKEFYKVIAELDTQTAPETTLNVSPDYSYANRADSPRAEVADSTISGASGFWGIAVWNQFYWNSGSAVGEVEADIDGQGKNMSLLIYSESTYDKPHTIHSVLVDYAVIGFRP